MICHLIWSDEFFQCSLRNQHRTQFKLLQSFINRWYFLSDYLSFIGYVFSYFILVDSIEFSFNKLEGQNEKMKVKGPKYQSWKPKKKIDDLPTTHVKEIFSIRATSNALCRKPPVGLLVYLWFTYSHKFEYKMFNNNDNKYIFKKSFGKRRT